MMLGLQELSSAISTGAIPRHNYRAELDPSGNWCGHDPKNPKYFKPNSGHKYRPDVLQYASNNLQRYYEAPKKWLTSIDLSRFTPRKQRSEGRERDAAVLGVILHYTELASLRVGIPCVDGEFISLSMKAIAKKLDWRSKEDEEEDRDRVEKEMKPKNKGVKRVWRAIKSLKTAGYISVHRRCEKHLEEENEYTSMPAIKRVFPKLFYELGISNVKLDKKRQEATKRLKNKYRGYLKSLEINGVNKVRSIRSVQNILNKKNSFSRNSFRSIQKEKDRQAKCFELKQLPGNRELSASEFYNKYPALKPQNK